MELSEPEIKPVLPAIEVQHLFHWTTREDHFLILQKRMIMITEYDSEKLKHLLTYISIWEVMINSGLIYIGFQSIKPNSVSFSIQNQL